MAVAGALLPDDTLSSGRDWIDDDEAITKLLSHAAAKRLVLAVGGSGGPRNALLLAADPISRQLIIDPPFPALAERLMPGMQMALSTRINGAVTEFTTLFESFAERAGETVAVLSWPLRLRYLQRRSSYRLGIPHELVVPPMVISDQNRPIKATLVDLSHQGAGAMVARQTAPRAGESIACTIRVEEVEFTASAEVRSCIGSLDRMRLGLQFGDIEPAAASKIAAAMAKLERISLRRAADRRARHRP